MIESAVELAARTGKTVLLRLERQGVGGYLWSIGQLPPALGLAGERQEAEPGADVGGGVVLVAELIADAPGRHTFTCELRRPWGARELAERRTVTVVVT